MILSDIDLRSYIETKRLQIIPFESEIIRENGLDLRIGNNCWRLKEGNGAVFDSRKKNYEGFYDKYTLNPSITLKPHEKILLTTLETIKIPLDLMAFCELRSSYARMGLTIPPTCGDAGFEGQLTIEVSGSTFPVTLYKEDRFMHVVFSKLTTQVTKPYRGVYQHQEGATRPL